MANSMILNPFKGNNSHITKASHASVYYGDRYSF